VLRESCTYSRCEVCLCDFPATFTSGAKVIDEAQMDAVSIVLLCFRRCGPILRV